MSAWGTVSIPAASAIDMTRCSLSGRHVYSDDADSSASDSMSFCESPTSGSRSVPKNFFMHDACQLPCTDDVSLPVSDCNSKQPSFGNESVKKNETLSRHLVPPSCSRCGRHLPYSRTLRAPG